MKVKIFDEIVGAANNSVIADCFYDDLWDRSVKWVQEKKICHLILEGINFEKCWVLYAAVRKTFISYQTEESKL